MEMTLLRPYIGVYNIPDNFKPYGYVIIKVDEFNTRYYMGQTKNLKEAWSIAKLLDGGDVLYLGDEELETMDE